MAQDPVQRANRVPGPDAATRSQDAMGDAGPRLRVWPFLVGLACVMRRGVALAGLLIAAWLVLAGLRVLRTGEAGDTWLLVAGLAWLVAALRFRPLVFVRADVTDMNPTLPAWAAVLGVSGSGYVLVGPRHGDLAVVWVHPVIYPAGARYPRMVQRVIGVPGDRVAIRQGRVWRNGALLSEPYCLVPFPGDYRKEEAEIPPRHYLVLPDDRGAGSYPDDRSPRRAGWLLGTEHVLGRVWFRPSEQGGVQTVPRRWPWLEPLGLLLGPVAWALHWCWAQLRGCPPQPAPGDDEPARVHTLCNACQDRTVLFPRRRRRRRRGLPPGFRWVTPTGLQAPPRSPGLRE